MDRFDNDIVDFIWVETCYSGLWWESIVDDDELFAGECVFILSELHSTIPQSLTAWDAFVSRLDSLPRMGVEIAFNGMTSTQKDDHELWDEYSADTWDKLFLW